MWTQPLWTHSTQPLQLNVRTSFRFQTLPAVRTGSLQTFLDCIFAHHNFVKFTDCLVLTHCWLEVRLSSLVFQSIHIEEAQLRPDRADCKLSCFRLPNHPNVIFFLEAFVCVKAVSGGNAVKAALSWISFHLSSSFDSVFFTYSIDFLSFDVSGLHINRRVVVAIILYKSAIISCCLAGIW
jgi:hypothetical protein